MSILSPKIADAITEHSMCQPGRPGPHGEGQEGSPGLEAFQRAKSAAERRPVATDNAPGRALHERRKSVELCQPSRPTLPFFQELSIALAPRLEFSVIVHFRFVESPCVEIHAPVDLIAVAVFDNAVNKRHNLRNVFGYSCQRIRVSHPEAAHVLEELVLPVRGQ